MQIFTIIATSLLYLGLYLGPYSILVTAGLGGVYIYSYCSCYSCCRVAGAAIKVASGTAIGTTYSVAVEIASGISKVASGIGRGSYKDSYRGCYQAYCQWVKMLFTDLAYCTGCLSAVGVREDISVLKQDRACADKAYADGACLDKAYLDKACLGGAYIDGTYCGAYCRA